MVVTHGALQPARGRCALTIGNFDGVHRGHRALIDRVVTKAGELRLTSSVLTFEPHPREFFAPEAAPPRLTRLYDKLELMAACEDFAEGHLLQAFSLVGTRADAELALVAEAENLERIHEFHVVLAQSGLMKWARISHSFLGMRKGSEYSEDERTVPRALRGRYVFVYPFVKSREWYALPADERWRIMQAHISVGREYPGVDNHTAYSFGLDDQEFVVAFESDSVSDFLDLVHEMRESEASTHTVRDVPSFTCIAMPPAEMVAALG